MRKPDYTRENIRIPDSEIIDTFSKTISVLDRLKIELKEKKKLTPTEVMEFCIGISNFASCFKTINTRYLNKSGFSNAKLHEFSSPELFVLLKKEIRKDVPDITKRINLEWEAFFIVMDLRNKLSHTINQEKHMYGVLEASGDRKIVNYLESLTEQSIFLKDTFKMKSEAVERVIKNNKEASIETYHPYGIVTNPSH